MHKAGAVSEPVEPSLPCRPWPARPTRWGVGVPGLFELSSHVMPTGVSAIAGIYGCDFVCPFLLKKRTKSSRPTSTAHRTWRPLLRHVGRARAPNPVGFWRSQFVRDKQPCHLDAGMCDRGDLWLRLFVLPVSLECLVGVFFPRWIDGLECKKTINSTIFTNMANGIIWKEL